MEGATQELRQTLSSPPPNWHHPHHNNTNNNPIAILHASLEHLRTTGDERYLFLRTLLEVLTIHGFTTTATQTATQTTTTTTNTTATNPASGTPLSGDEEQLLFHCATGLRHVILFRWDSFRPSFRSCVRDFLLAVGLGLTFGDNAANADTESGIIPCLPRTVAMACLSGAASIWKRGWTTATTMASSSNDYNNATAAVQDDGQQAYLESLICTTLLPHMHRMGLNNNNMNNNINNTNGEECQELFTYLNSLLSSPFEESATTTQLAVLQYHHKRYTAAMASSFLSLLVGEFTGGNSSARYNLPVEFHRLCHQVFENGNVGSVSVGSGAADGKSGLDATLHLSMTALSSLVGYILNNNNSTTSATNNSPAIQDESLLEFGTCVINVTFDVLSWEFGWDFSTGKGSGGSSSSMLLRPPQRWREILIRPDFLGAVFHVYTAVRVGGGGGGGEHVDIGSGIMQKRGRMAHQLRQLLLQLSSIALGPIFADQNERGAYAGFLLDGCLNVLGTIFTEQQQHQGQVPEDSIIWEHKSAEIVDLVTMLSRITSNFKIQTLSQLPTFPRFLSALCTMGKWLLEASLAECQRLHGDVESMEGIDWKNDAIAQILQCSEVMAGDYWLVSGAGGQEAKAASQALAMTLAPLYGVHCMSRVRMACLEEHFLVREGAELDEVREEISALGLEEEMASAASLGRLNVLASMTTLSGMFQECIPKLMTLFAGVGTGGEITADMAALLEEARMLIICACHLLTDECDGETPAIPESVIYACKPDGGSEHGACTSSIVGLVNLLKSAAEEQAMRVTVHPEDPRLSPLLAKTLLWFFNRWGAAYILPSSDEYREDTGGILGTWSTPESAQPIISFFSTLCLLYFCHWPQEKEVQDESTSLLLALAKKGPVVRDLLVASPSFESIAALHSVCASLRHNASQPEIAAAMAAIGGDLSLDVVRGYVRMPYSDRAKVLTCLVVGCSEMRNEKGTAMLNSCLKAVETPFSTIVQALSNKQAHSQDINVQESACLSILLYGGVVLASEMSEPERIPHFLSPSLPHISGLMNFYAEDLTICESILKLFRDYAEQYLNMLTRDQCINLFTSSASLLKSYSANHCKSRVVHKKIDSVEADFEEEQNYNDVLCAIQLLIHLGTKDFIDLCNTRTHSSTGVESSQITDVIFFGLQQILPLMTQGLLQFPTLCMHYFSLVGFMVETYPQNLCALPIDLFSALLDSLLFGMSHSDPLVSKSSLQGLAGLFKEHLKTHALAAHLSVKPDIVDNCTSRLIQEVIFQPIIWDRLEPAGMALLPLAAIDVQKFVGLVNAISQQLGPDDKQKRLHSAFEKLIKPDVLAKVAMDGREGRVVRVQFKKDFDVFVLDVQSFLVMK